MFHIIAVYWDATSSDCRRSTESAAWAAVDAARADHAAAIWVYSPDNRLLWEYNDVFEEGGLLTPERIGC